MARPQPPTRSARAPLEGLDLNLLVTLRALLQTTSVTRAAELLGTTQPTVSRGLAALRLAFGDPLLVRAGRVMVRTPLAESLWPRLESALDAVEVLVESAPFEPASGRRRWRVLAPDLVALALQPALLARLQEVAPGASLEFHEYTHAIGPEIDAREVDLIVGPIPRDERLHEVRLPPCGRGWSVVYGAHLGPSLAPRSREAWLDARHLAVGPCDGTQRSILDAMLEAHGHRRFVAAVLPSMSSVAETLAYTDLVASLPTPIAEHLAQDSRIVFHPHPFSGDLPPLRVDLLWHDTHQDDEAHAWFRQEVLDVVASLMGATREECVVV